MKSRYTFPAIFHFADDGISIEYPDLPGCLSCADTEEEAFKMAKEVLQLHLYGMEQDKDIIPEPSKIKDIRLEENETVVLIEVFMPSFRDKMNNKAVNKMVTLPRWLNELADKENVNCSQIFQNALKAYLEVDHRQ
ncbi:MAG: pilus assembly protein HicB [Pelosinus sp.]|nr:pilus assembly protein HicB [Pelosinus sp.]MDF2859265.1 pilus assembly protein HicB [Neobacillus sp.]